MIEGPPKEIKPDDTLIGRTWFVPEPRIYRVMEVMEDRVTVMGIRGFEDDGRGPTTSIIGRARTFDLSLAQKMLPDPEIDTQT